MRIGYEDKDEKDEIKKRLDEIEAELRKMQKQWIDMYETVIRLMHEK